VRNFNPRAGVSRAELPRTVIRDQFLRVLFEDPEQGGLTSTMLIIRAKVSPLLGLAG